MAPEPSKLPTTFLHSHSEPRKSRLPGTSPFLALLRRCAWVALVAVAITAAALLGILPCPLAFFLHVPCPVCGLKSATLRLLHGDLHGALRFHPLVVVALPLIAAFFGANTWVYIRTGQWGATETQVQRPVSLAAFVLAIVTVGVWISRFFGAFGGPVAVFLEQLLFESNASCCGPHELCI